MSRGSDHLAITIILFHCFRGEEEIDSDTEWDDFDETSDIGSNRPAVESRQEDLIDEFPEISGITTAREAMKKLPEAERLKIAEQVEEFRSERVKFDREVSKWDDQGNDVIVLAKHMCMIMMEMTDFTRGRGPLQTTMAVINAARWPLEGCSHVPAACSVRDWTQASATLLRAMQGYLADAKRRCSAPVAALPEAVLAVTSRCMLRVAAARIPRCL